MLTEEHNGSNTKSYQFLSRKKEISTGAGIAIKVTVNRLSYKSRGVAKTHSVYCSNALPTTDSIASFIPIPAKLAADSTSPRVYALLVLASAIERE